MGTLVDRKANPLFHLKVTGKTIGSSECASIDIAGVGGHARISWVSPQRGAGNPCAMTVDIVPGVPWFGGDEVCFGNHSRIVEAVETRESGVEIIYPAIDDANDHSRAISQQNSRNIAINCGYGVVQRVG